MPCYRSKERRQLWSVCTRCANGTLVYLFDKPGHEPNVAAVDLDLQRLSKIVRGLFTGIHGNSLYPQIDAAHPEKHNAFFQDFLGLRSAFEPLMRWLKNFKRIVISPHGLWHSLPLHVLLLPMFWEKDLCPGISYVPSAKVALLLQQRIRRVEYRPAGLTSVPASSMEQPLFAAVHEMLSKCLASAGLPVHTLYGCE